MFFGSDKINSKRTKEAILDFCFSLENNSYLQAINNIMQTPIAQFNYQLLKRLEIDSHDHFRGEISIKESVIKYGFDSLTIGTKTYVNFYTQGNSSLSLVMEHMTKTTFIQSLTSHRGYMDVRKDKKQAGSNVIAHMFLSSLVKQPHTLVSDFEDPLKFCA